MKRLLFGLVLLLVPAASEMQAQATQSQLQERLVGQPLYLRGFWLGSKLEFDGSGQPLGNPVAGPMTLSGIDVHSVAISGKQMQIKGDRVVLIADAEGRLQRKTPYSTTIIAFSLRRGDDNKYKAKEEMTLLVHADAQGSFEPALKAIFADGLAELATSAPPHWTCYAAGFFAKDVALDEAKRITDACVRRRGFLTDDSAEGFKPPKEPKDIQLHATREAAELGIDGVSTVHMTIGPHGVPLRFQIVRAVGAGMDDALVQAISESRFQPAMKNGEAVPADYEKSVGFRWSR